jgi:AraC family transcriptional regulator
VLLLTKNDSIVGVALASGFQNHEVFCRAFQRRFGMSPRAYRKRGFAQNVDAAQRANHAALVFQVAVCLRLYGRKSKSELEKQIMTYSISRIELAPQPVLIVRRRVKRSEIAAAIAEALPRILAYVQEHGIALAGLPFTRFIQMGPGLVSMEPGMRIAGPGETRNPIDREGEIVADTLQGGLAAMTTHLGPYENLQEAYAAIEQWIDAQGFQRGGPPWESYVTDPAEHPNPQDWKTEVYWPLSS